jgi:hypothetical protein
LRLGYAGFSNNFSDCLAELKCRLRLESIAMAYRLPQMKKGRVQWTDPFKTT